MLLKSLRKYFGFDSFRPGQKEIITDILDKKNVLAIMPTGAGKSLCYQLPSLLSETYSIIISPLISLMQDQVNSLNQENYSAAFINSSLDYKDTEKVLNDLFNKKIKMLFIAPEKLNNVNFVERIKQTNPEYLFVDEAHCISEWGHNFRPSYRNINNFAKSIGVKNISAFTATATPEVRKDIIEQLEFENPKTHISGFERENISLNVIFERNKKEKIFEILQNCKKSAIVYTSTRRHAEQLSKYLNLKKIENEFYHAGLSNELRRIIQDNFISGRTKIIIATNAFGMGIDKADIEFVIHYNIPSSIENLYQEFGRAGRDGSEAKAFLFYTNRDKEIQDFFINISFPNVDQIKKCYIAILDYHKVAVNTKTDKLLEIEKNLIKLIESKEIHKGLIPAILSNLENSGYLKLHSSNTLNHFVKILLSPNDLKKYLNGMYNAELKDFVLQLLKTFGTSVFSSGIQIDFDFMYNSFGYTKNTIEEFLFTLNNVGIIKYDKPTFSQKVEMLIERVESKNLRLNKDEIDVKIINAKNKLQKIIDYTNSTECRFKFILDYFGEETGNYKCGKCDNCTNESISVKSNDFISEIIIRTFKEFKGGLTENRIIGILKGTSQSNVAKKISTYESCKFYKMQEIEDSIQNLLNKNILKNINNELFFNPLEELFSVDETEFDNSDIAKNTYEDNLELFNKLREERDLAAKKFSQNAQIICSDKILREISQNKPQTPSQLMQINGFNQRMFNKIGDEFLAIIKDQAQSENERNFSRELPGHISQTYDLVCKKYSLYDISKLLKLPESIVSIQLETIISYYPNMDYSFLLNKNEFEQIKNSIVDINEDLKSIKSKLDNSISFAKIRIVKAMLKSTSSN